MNDDIEYVESNVLRSEHARLRPAFDPNCPLCVEIRAAAREEIYRARSI